MAQDEFHFRNSLSESKKGARSGTRYVFERLGGAAVGPLDIQRRRGTDRRRRRQRMISPEGKEETSSWNFGESPDFTLY